MFKIENQFKIRINYKSGIQEEFWVSSFRMKGDDMSWTEVSWKKRPIHMADSVEDIESVWQVGVRKRIVLWKKEN